MAQQKPSAEQQTDDESLFRQIFEKSHTVELIVDLRSGRIVDANPAAASFYGWSRQELKSMNIGQINTLSPETMAKVLVQIEEANGGFFYFQHRLASGQIRNVETSNTTMEIGGRRLRLVIVHDITDQKHAEESLLLAQHALESSSNGITIADALQRGFPIIYANAAFEKITGYSLAEVKGRNCSFLTGPERNQPTLAELRSALVKGRPCEVVLRNYRKDGTLFWNELHVSPIRDAAGNVTHYVGVHQDVSDRRRADAQIEHLAYFDALTDLPNRRLLLDRLTISLALQRNYAA